MGGAGSIVKFQRLYRCRLRLSCRFLRLERDIPHPHVVAAGQSEVGRDVVRVQGKRLLIRLNGFPESVGRPLVAEIIPFQACLIGCDIICIPLGEPLFTIRAQLDPQPGDHATRDFVLQRKDVTQCAVREVARPQHLTVRGAH